MKVDSDLPQGDFVAPFDYNWGKSFILLILKIVFFNWDMSKSSPKLQPVKGDSKSLIMTKNTLFQTAIGDFVSLIILSHVFRQCIWVANIISKFK